MEKRRVVITGVGAITPIGHTAAESWQAVRGGVCGVAPISAFDAADMKVKLAAEVKDYAPEAFLDKKEAKHMDRFTQFAVIAAREALRDADFSAENADLDRCGVIVSSGIGGLQDTEEQHDRGRERGFDRVSPFYIPMAICNMAAGRVAIEAGFRGMCSCPVTACAGGTYAVGDAFHYIRDRYADAMLCGGSESAVTPLAIGGFTSMKALTAAEDPNRASIPFDAERSGFVLGEGAAVLLLEELEHAKARGAKIYAEILGCANNNDAFHITSPRPGGEGGALCMALALEQAGLKPEDVDYINTHGTATHMGDAYECAAIHTVFGQHAKELLISSTKSATGHLMGAGGITETIACIQAIREGIIPPTVNYETPDPDCDLDCVPNTARKADVRIAMNNALGFGGQNASLIVGRFEE